MTGRTSKKGKHIPQRTCVGCRLVLPKRTLIRIVRTPNGVAIDGTGKANGRGAYLHNRQICWEKGLKGALAHALRMDLTEHDRELLLEYMATLPPDATSEDETSTTVNQSQEVR